MDFSFNEAKNKKGQNLIINGFKFRRNKTNENFIYLKCSEINCPSRVTMTGDSKSVFKKPGEHNHLPPDEKIQQENFRKTVIQSVEQNVSRSLKKSYDEAIQGNSEDFLPPKYEKIRKSMSRKRAEILPESPKTLEDVKIEGAWQNTKQGIEFVLHQEIGLVIFATTESLEFLVRSKNIMGNGTFKSARINQDRLQFLLTCGIFWIFGRISLTLWNVFDRPLNLRTTNKCESWNRDWNASVGTKNPVFWTVVQKLGEQEQYSRLGIRRISRGEASNIQKKKYRDLNEKISRLKNSYLDGTSSLKNYWEGVSNICSNFRN